jgi:hypothetical protein
MSKRKKYQQAKQKPVFPKVEIKEEPEEASFLGFTIPPGIKKGRLTQDIFILVMISIAMKIFTLIFTSGIGSFIDYFDIAYYEKFAVHVFNGMIPYVNFTVDYPQGLFFIILIPYALVVMFGAATNPLPMYALTHHIIMTMFDTGTIVLLYLIAVKIYNRRRAMVSALMYATALSASYFVLTKYDAFPTFLLMLSIAFYIYRKETAGYLAGAFAFLSKWFPAVALPFFVLNDIKKGVERKTILKNIGYAVAAVLIVMVPFLVMSPSGFIETYTVNANVPVLTHGFIYYLDFIFRTSFFGDISFYLMAIAELALLGLYYLQPKKDDKTLIAYIAFAIFAFVIFNRAASPQHLQWLAPFLALFLSSWYGAIVFYGLQAVLYLEFPLVYGTFYDNTVGYGAARGIYWMITSFLIFTMKFMFLFFAMMLLNDERRIENGGIKEGIVHEMVARIKYDLNKHGTVYTLKFMLNIISGLISYPFLKKSTFTFNEKPYTYFYHWYNITHKNERCVEIPIIKEELDKVSPDKVLEIGNVLSHYFPSEHTVVDKYEDDGKAVNVDIMDYRTDKKFDLIVSISTIEHIGWDDRTNIDGATIMKKMMDLLSDNGKIIVTIPIGYNPVLDSQIRSGDINKAVPYSRIYCMVRDGNAWRQEECKNTEKLKYGDPDPYASGIIILIAGKHGDKV